MENFFPKYDTQDLSKLIKRLLIQLVLSCFIVSVGIGQTHTYYISGSGNDNNTGSIENPFKTIQKAAGLMNAGDTCLIRGGTYRETIIPARSGAWGKPILFMSYSCEKVIISGADSVSGKWTVYDGNIYKRYMPWTMGAGKDMVFVDGKLIVIPTTSTIKKLQPSKHGTPCDPRDVCIVVDSDKPHIKWSLTNHETN